jgi:hypothetical protein
VAGEDVRQWTITREAVERLAVFLWVKEMRHTDHPNSERAALRWWENASDGVRESWLKHAHAALLAAAAVDPSSSGEPHQPGTECVSTKDRFVDRDRAREQLRERVERLPWPFATSDDVLSLLDEVLG